jgi:hypothetical protein
MVLLLCANYCYPQTRVSCFFFPAPDIRRRDAQRASLRINHQNAGGIVRVFLCMDVCVRGAGGACVCACVRERERERETRQQTQTPATLLKSKTTPIFFHAHTCVPHIPKTRRMRGLRSFEPFGLPLRALFPPCVSPCDSRRVRVLSS